MLEPRAFGDINSWCYGAGWSYKRSGGVQVWREGAVEVVGIPYSEHSSWNDLRDCVGALRPKKIIPTVNAANPGELVVYISVGSTGTSYTWQ